jgi:hypothetical protein
MFLELHLYALGRMLALGGAYDTHATFGEIEGQAGWLVGPGVWYIRGMLMHSPGVKLLC